MGKEITKKIGEIGVDAGLCWIGDPSYVLHREQPPKAIGKNWGEFCDLVNHDKGFTSFGDGFGVCVSTGYGDGIYLVYATIKDGRIMKVWIDFQL